MILKLADGTVFHDIKHPTLSINWKPTSSNINFDGGIKLPGLASSSLISGNTCFNGPVLYEGLNHNGRRRSRHSVSLKRRQRPTTPPPAPTTTTTNILRKSGEESLHKLILHHSGKNHCRIGIVRAT